MINYTRAYSLQSVKYYVERRSTGCSDLREYKNIAWVGFVPAGPSPIAHLPNSLIVEMDDISEERPVMADGSKIIFPSREIAAEIVEFVRRYAKSKESWAIAVHCTGGMSRSPAVSTWVHETYLQSSMPQWHFNGLHPYATPNPVLLRLLREVASEKRSEAKAGAR